jgi:hypothetical protein
MEPGLMSQVGTSAQDPVFYLHHTNMDRLWESWKAITLDGASHTDPPDISWQETAYEFFDDTGTKLNPPWMVKEVLDTTVTELGYVYERLADNAWFEANCAEFRPIQSAPTEAISGTPVAAVESGSNTPEGESRSGPSRWKCRSSLRHQKPPEHLPQFRVEPACSRSMALREQAFRASPFRSISISLRGRNRISARRTTSVRLVCSPSSRGMPKGHTKDTAPPSRSTFLETSPHCKRPASGPAKSM